MKKSAEEDILDITEFEQTVKELSTVIDKKEDFGQSFSLVEQNKNQAIQLADEVRKSRELLKNTNFDDDFAYVKDNLSVLIAQANDALTNLISLAKTSEHPKAYEVLGTYIKIVAEVNSQILQMHKTRKEVRSQFPPTPAGGVGTQNIQQNIVFNGSTSDILDIISQSKGNM